MILDKKLELFEKNINFYFKDRQNLINALIHPSFIKDKYNKKKKMENFF